MLQGPRAALCVFALACVALVPTAVVGGISTGIAASIKAPGGLSREQTPQFMLLSNDDSITQEVYNILIGVTESRKSLNGCKATATMFTIGDKTSNTVCSLAKDLHRRGYEIADHTARHISLRNKNVGVVEKELRDAKWWLNQTCGIPATDIVGMRAPYLDTDIRVREVAYKLGFLYDSTVLEETSGSSVSRGMTNRTWPFDMFNGVPLNCKWYDTIQTCSTSERWPGMMQVPIWSLRVNDKLYSMDPGQQKDTDNVPGRAYDVLKATFDAAYCNNRAPVPIFVHDFWLNKPNNLAGLKKFLDYALTMPDVYLVTMRQLIGWMKKPIPANRLTPEALGCGKAGGAYGHGRASAARAVTPAPAWCPKWTMPTSPSGGICGAGVARCPATECCSQYGWCGVKTEHCGAGCQAGLGRCNAKAAVAIGASAFRQRPANVTIPRFVS